MNSKIAILVALAVPLAGCGQDAGAPSDRSAETDAAQPPAAASPSDRLLAAAEPFEKLTETAFTATGPDLDVTIGEARTAANGVRNILTLESASGVDKLLGDLAQYRQGAKRTDIALASIEIYRILVSAVPAGTRVPSAVSLLDYAGFRYQADLQASPVRWNDMAAAMRYAREQWTSVAPQLASSPLSVTFEAALAEMEKAIVDQDATAAEKAATAELDLVDQLEGYFNKR